MTHHPARSWSFDDLAAPLFAVACVASLAHLLDLYRHLRGVVGDDGAAGGSA